MRKASPTETRRAKSESPDFPRAEWDFYPPPRGLLPNDEVLACHTYEVARLDARWAAEVRLWRAQSSQQSFAAFLNLRDKCLRNQQTVPHEFYVYWPEWPLKPYLKVLEPDRRARWREWTGRTFEQPSPLPSVSIQHLFAHQDAFCSGAKPDWVAHSGYREANIDPMAGTIRLPLKSEIAAFKIHFFKPDDVLTGEFKQWLQARRLQNGIPNPETRGEKGLTQRLRKELLTLGVWRLKAIAKLTNDQAIEYTERVSGRPLFAKPSTWSENLGRAKRAWGLVWWHQKSSS